MSSQGKNKLPSNFELESFFANLNKNSKKIKDYFFKISLVFIIISYFIIGFYNIKNIPITNDEIAHLASAQAYTQKYPINLEHPPVLKALNSVVINSFFGDFESQEDSQWDRGQEFLFESKYDTEDIIFSSRLVYLGFNSLIFLWLIFYTYYFKFIDQRISLFFAVLYTFSPNFLSHNILLTFDVGGSISVLMAILTLIFSLKNLTKLNLKDFWINLVVLSTLVFLAVGTKFSNLILLPILGIVLIALSIKKILDKDFEGMVRSWQIKIFSFGFLGVGLFSLYSFLMDFNPNNLRLTEDKSGILLTPIYNIIDGVSYTLSRSRNIEYVFINEVFDKIIYQDFIARVFWFKENPILLLFIAFIVISASVIIAKMIFSYKELSSLQKANYVFGVIFLAFPLIYFAVARNSYFTIGYRHFYPILIFIYFAISYLTVKLAVNKIQKMLVFGMLGLYVIFGIIGINQGIGYVNPLWNKPKWQLISDSTIYWGEYQIKAIEFLYDYDKSLWSENISDEKGIIFATWTHNKGTPTTPSLDVKTLGLGDKETLEDFDKFIDLTKEDVQDSRYRYIVYDVEAIQIMSDAMNKEENNKIVRENFEYLMDEENIIYSKNEVIFVVKLKR